MVPEMDDCDVGNPLISKSLGITQGRSPSIHNGSVMPALQRAYNIAQAESSGRVLQTGLPRLAELQQIIS